MFFLSSHSCHRPSDQRCERKKLQIVVKLQHASYVSTMHTMHMAGTIEIALAIDTATSHTHAGI